MPTPAAHCSQFAWTHPATMSATPIGTRLRSSPTVWTGRRAGVILPMTGIEAMDAYRLYFVGGDGHFAGVEIIDADDDAAIQAARKFAGPLPMELWNLSRRLEMYPAASDGREKTG